MECAIEVMRLVFDRGVIAGMSFIAGMLAVIGAWILLRVIPKMDTYTSLIASYHKFRKEERRKDK